MMDSIILGLRDIWKNKFIFLLILTVMLMISTIFISSTLSLSREFQRLESTRNNTQFRIVVTSTDMGNNAELTDQTVDFINEYGVSHLQSGYYSSRHNAMVIIMLGDTSLYSPKLNSGNKTTIYANSNMLSNEKHINFDGTEFEMIELIDPDFLLYDIYRSHVDDRMVFINYKGDDIKSVMDLNEGIELLQLVSNTKFVTDWDLNTNRLKEILDNIGFMTLVPQHNNSGELKFIYHYVYPFLAITGLCLLLGIYLANSYLLDKMSREHTISMFYGAKVSNIVARHSVMVVVSLIILLYILIGVMNGWNFDFVALLAFASVVFQIILIGITLLKQIMGKIF